MRRWKSEVLEQLLDIQDVDMKIRAISHTIEQLYHRCMREDLQLNNMKAELEQVEENLNATKVQREMYQSTLEDIRNAIKGLMANRSGIFRPRTRSSTEALKIEEDKLAVLLVETDSQIQRLSEDAAAIRDQIQERSAEVALSQQAPEAEIRQRRDEKLKLEAERAKRIRGLPEPLLRKYDRLKASRSGMALTVLSDGICKVCRMQMPTGVYSRLVKGEYIHDCPACGRMVARIQFSIDFKQMAEEAKAAEAAKEEERKKQEAAKERRIKAAERTERLKEQHERKLLQAAMREAAQQQERANVTAGTATKTTKTAAAKATPAKKATAKATPAKAEAAAKTTAAKKAPAKKAPAKATPAKKATAKATPAKKAAAKATPVKKTAAKATPAKKTAAKKATPVKKATPAKKTAVKKAPAKKAPAKKAPAKATPVKKAPVKKAPAKKAPAKKAPAKKAPAKKAPAKKAPAKAQRSR